MATKIIKAWVNGGVQNIEVQDITSDPQPINGTTISTVTLLAESWNGSAAPYSQVVTIDGVTANTKVDLKPTSAQIAEMQDSDIAFVAENDNGVVTVYSINCKPETDYTMQAVLTEVTSA